MLFAQREKPIMKYEQTLTHIISKWKRCFRTEKRTEFRSIKNSACAHIERPEISPISASMEIVHQIMADFQLKLNAKLLENGIRIQKKCFVMKRVWHLIDMRGSKIFGGHFIEHFQRSYSLFIQLHKNQCKSEADRSFFWIVFHRTLKTCAQFPNPWWIWVNQSHHPNATTIWTVVITFECVACSSFHDMLSNTATSVHRANYKPSFLISANTSSAVLTNLML